jgi:hypothetical protein
MATLGAVVPVLFILSALNEAGRSAKRLRKSCAAPGDDRG